MTGGRLPAAGGPESGAGLGAGGEGRVLRLLLGELGEAKRRLLGETEALRVIETRVREWDLSQPFQARRGRALRVEATVRFSDALDDLHELLARLSDGRQSPALAASPLSPRRRRLLAAIRSELRYLQRAFDGGNLLLANTLETFSPP
ncbi:MAG TPA: hypothetical protein VMU50_05160 [Polyangia bacterium]|nr:hypothetical protein [Polyangia bacterium]